MVAIETINEFISKLLTQFIQERLIHHFAYSLSIPSALFEAYSRSLFWSLVKNMGRESSKKLVCNTTEQHMCIALASIILCNFNASCLFDTPLAKVKAFTKAHHFACSEYFSNIMSPLLQHLLQQRSTL